MEAMIIMVIIGVIVALFVVRLVANKLANGTAKAYLAHQVVELLFFAGALATSFFIMQYSETSAEWEVDPGFLALFLGLIFVGEFWGFSMLNEESHQAIQGRVSESIFGDELYYREEEVTIRENTLFDTIWRAVLFTGMHGIILFFLSGAYDASGEPDFFPILWISTGVSCIIRLFRVLKLLKKVKNEY